MDIFTIYQSSLAAIGGLVFLMIMQLVIADVIGIKSKHIPGAAITSNHDNLHFRASRTVANTNESIGIFILAFLFSVFSAAPATWVAYSTWGFLASRMIYAIFYYFNLQVFRSISFVLGLLSMVCLFGSGASKWL